MTWNSTTIDFLAERDGHKRHWLMWCRARTYDTGSPVEFGFWTGNSDVEHTVDSVVRAYYGSQENVPADIRYTKGFDAVPVEISFAITPEAEAMVRGFDTRDAEIELHAAIYNSANLLVGIGRKWRGIVDGTRMVISEIDGRSSLTITTYSSEIHLTMTRTRMKSDASQRLRDPDDRFREYSALGASIASDPWAKKA